MRYFLVFAFALGCAPPPTPPPVCTSVITLLCEDGDVVSYDSCEDQGTLAESCAAGCFLGECVGCEPNAGFGCDGDDLVRFDSCGVATDVIQSCVDGCAQGACVVPECSEISDTICDGNFIVNVDSCGTPRTIAQRCPDANPCQDGRCDGCLFPESIGCYEGDVWEYDGCGQRIDIQSLCDSQSCTDDGGGTAVCSDTACTDNASIVCHEGDLHFADSCGNVQVDVFESCLAGCDSTGCLNDCAILEVGQLCIDGNVHQLEDSCGTRLPGVILESCDNGCRGGECAPGDCLADQGRVCQDGNVHSVDSCRVAGPLLETCDGACEKGACQ